MIYINEVYMNVDTNEYIRIINIDANNDIFHFVICFKNYAYPKPYKISLFQDEIDRNIIVKVPDVFSKVIDEESINKSDLEKRDFYWQIVEKGFMSIGNIVHQTNYIMNLQGFMVKIF